MLLQAVLFLSEYAFQFYLFVLRRPYVLQAPNQSWKKDLIKEICNLKIKITALSVTK